MKKNKFLLIILALATTMSFTACGSSTSKESASTKQIKIGVSIWSSTDVLGSQSKKMLDAAGKALNVKLVYVDQGHESAAVTDSINTLAAAGCDGIIICNSADSEMTSAINTCNAAHIYLAQFYRTINKIASPQVYSLAKTAPYYIGAVHEDEVTNGYNLANMLIKKGDRHIDLEGWVAGDATFISRWQGYKKAVAEWNSAHASDKVIMSAPQYAGTTAEQGAAVANSFMNSDSKMDALIVAGGGGDPLVGSVGAIKSAGKTGKIDVVSTDFLPDLGTQLTTGGMTGESGGHYADPLYAFMMVYNAAKGNYKKPANSFDEIVNPYIYVASAAEYNAYAKYFVTELPYNEKELKAMANDTLPKLKQKAAAISVKDVQTRHSVK
ncbi:sugar ABC transporter substrate-binding protein [Clostridium estertheticum]|uniref:sugar ABC transporter substrate-binding protein n=1 Tax=Clostridium estertheticum TaxID=238834 RepID=UPI001CF4E737|nr:substrate-binding domain-containing protein [Clostridium estertheticum]MCB2340471.1 substrate-binding domain-containing protein [Clostridium estertheticum]